METSLYGMTVGKSRKASNVRITDGEVSGSAKDEVDNQRIKRSVQTKCWRNSCQHGIGHTWKRIKEAAVQISVE